MIGWGRGGSVNPGIDGIGGKEIWGMVKPGRLIPVGKLGICGRGTCGIVGNPKIVGIDGIVGNPETVGNPGIVGNPGRVGIPETIVDNPGIVGSSDAVIEASTVVSTSKCPPKSAEEREICPSTHRTTATAPILDLLLRVMAAMFGCLAFANLETSLKL
jgi:hypothetical protein